MGKMSELAIDLMNGDLDELYVRCLLGDLSTIKGLVEMGINLNPSINPPLWGAVYGGHLDVVKYLVENGADISLQAEFNACAKEYSDLKNGETLLNLASRLGFSNIVEYLSL